MKKRIIVLLVVAVAMITAVTVGKAETKKDQPAGASIIGMCTIKQISAVIEEYKFADSVQTHVTVPDTTGEDYVSGKWCPRPMEDKPTPTPQKTVRKISPEAQLNKRSDNTPLGSFDIAHPDVEFDEHGVGHTTIDTTQYYTTGGDVYEIADPNFNVEQIEQDPSWQTYGKYVGRTTMQ